MSNWSADAGDRMQRRLAFGYLIGASTVIAVMVGVLLLQRRQVALPGFIGVVLLGPLTGALAGFIVWIGAGIGSRAIVSTISGAGNIKPAPSYSLQESLVIRGRFAEAEAAYHAHLAAHPGDLDAHLALAALVRDHLQDSERAEQLFREARARTPTWAQEYAISNALIDLYRKTGQIGKEMAELARFADRYKETDGGRRAREALRRIKEEPR
jgi:tetratricopeptide (TPR) repeat protein